MPIQNTERERREKSKKMRIVYIFENQQAYFFIYIFCPATIVYRIKSKYLLLYHNRKQTFVSNGCQYN